MPQAQEYIIDQVLPILRRLDAYKYVSFTEMNSRWVRVHLHVDSDTSNGAAAHVEVHAALDRGEFGHMLCRFIGGMPEREDYIFEIADSDPWQE
jgi:hypothetical protein